METQLEVKGMNCGKCVAHVKSALEAVENVQSAEVNLEQNSAVVTHDPQMDPQTLVRAVEEEGYEASVRG
jgi:copper chaperone